jgi:hypothetical protein
VEREAREEEAGAEEEEREEEEEDNEEEGREEAVPSDWARFRQNWLISWQNCSEGGMLEDASVVGGSSRSDRPRSERGEAGEEKRGVEKAGDAGGKREEPG